MPGVSSTLVYWPEAEEIFEPQRLRKFIDETDVLCLYDLPGITFNQGHTPTLFDPSENVVAGWHQLVEHGIPILGMHHAIASWPTWPFFAELLKGRFHYVPASLRGVEYPDSGYTPYTKQEFTVVAPQHPVCAGLPSTFSLTDETYLCPIFSAEVTPLLVTNAPQNTEVFKSAFAAIRREEQTTWAHPDGVPLVAWTHEVMNSQVVYLQPGDGPEAFANPSYQLLVHNAITWLAQTKGGPRGL